MNNIAKELDEITHIEKDDLYWSERDLHKIIGYSSYQKFKQLLDRSLEKAHADGYSDTDLFNYKGKKVKLGSNAERMIKDRMLTVLACKYLFECANGNKEAVIKARDYFYIKDKSNNENNTGTQDEITKAEIENHYYWEENTKNASKLYIDKMGQLDFGLNSKEKLTEGFYRDDSYLGNPSPHHIIYKFGEPLFSKDKKRAYEFLIEYDIYEPCTGIYYGCKGLTLEEGIHELNIKEFREEWENIKELTGKILSNTFPYKNFKLRFKPTNNANNNTYWPFWITLYEEEDIIEVAARAIKCIKAIFKKELDLIYISDWQCITPILGIIEEENAKIRKTYSIVETSQNKDSVKTVTAFTDDAYCTLEKKIDSRILKDIINSLENTREIAEINDYYEKAWVIQCSIRDFIETIKQKINENNKKVCWKQIERVFIKGNHQTMFDCLRQWANENTHHTKRNKRIKL